VAAYNVKAGVDLKDAEIMCRTALASPWINLRGLHLHVGDQVPVAGPFALAVERVVDEAMRIEKSLGIEFELIDIGGGIPTKYKYETGNAELDNFYGGITPDDFAQAVLGKIEAWRPGIQICTEPGRKVVGSASALLTFIGAEKTKTVHDLDFNVVDRVHWMFVDAGYSLLADSLHFKWFYTVLNASRADDECDRWVKLAGPLCDGGDYYHQGIDGEFFPVPKATAPGDVVVFLDTGAYSIESQTTYNGYPRTAVYLINKKGEAELIRREDSYEDLIRNEKCCEG
jgi:diaminopimelate decarboxylase